ncbi:hypothetical protein [Nocardia sp. NPDC057353]|uniref:hypothetical protein n=1 Tax=Nocardia sp. NPDC057353 TaxID=3346104 RepID=UPI003640BC42
MTESRSGSMDVLVPRTLDDAQRESFIRRYVEQQLAKTGEHPVKVEARSGYAVPDDPSVMRWAASYTTGPAHIRIW